MTATDADVAVLATNKHYDQAPEIFAAFLGSRMKYTCGLYATGAETLDEAQEAKLRFIADALQLKSGDHVLDVGCGWGSLVVFLAELGYTVTGVTPSPKQASFVADRASLHPGRASVTRDSIMGADLSARTFDAVSLVGVAEALPDLDAVISKLAGHLRPGGRLYLSASCYRNDGMFREFQSRPASRHIAEDIFGYGTLRPLSTLVEAMEAARLSLVGTYDLTGHYRRTIKDWLARIAAKQQVIDSYRDGYADELSKYLTEAYVGFGYTTKHYALVSMRSRFGRHDLVA